MVNITNKLESDAFIISSGMNYTPFGLVYSAADAYNYIFCYQRNKEREPFFIRFKGIGMQPSLSNLSADAAYTFCLEHFGVSDTPLGILEATEGYDNYRTVNCEIRINKDCTIDAHYCKGNLKMRDALKSPGAKHLYPTGISFPCPVWGAGMDFKPLRWAIDYLCKYNIIDHVVELTKFSKNVGVKKQKIVCWEVRNF